jgi:hypothetical protein
VEENAAKAIAKLFASKFIARSDVRAIQLPDGEYRPQRDNKFDMPSLLAHLRGEQTFGHYMVSQDNKVKLFAFDIDLEKVGRLPDAKFGIDYVGWKDVELREHWASRKQGPGRDVIKLQMKMAASSIARAVTDQLSIPVAVAYSGSKGIHVYGFTGLVSCEHARKGAQIALEAAGYSLFKGNNWFRFDAVKAGCQDDPIANLANLNVEIYPKQDSLDSTQLGNLMRLPLGRNLRSPKDSCFFIDMRTAMSDFVPMDSIEALTTDNIWRYEGE